MPITERKDSQLWQPDRFLADLRQASVAIDAPFDADKVRQTLEVFEDEFRRCVVQMKATCKANTGVYYRFFYKWERDLTALAKEHGMMPADDSPIVRLQADVLSHCRGATRAGLDFDTSFGLAKEWTFTGGPTPVEEVAGLETMPDAVRKHLPFFQRHGLRHVFFTASDIQQNSMNVYFGPEEDCRNESWLRSLAEETGGTPTDPEVYNAMMASLAVSAGIGTTFYWDREDMGRWCLYGLNIPCFDAERSAALPGLPTRLQSFRDEAPTLNADPQFNVAWSFGQAGFYTKLEKSYAKDADYFLTVEMGGNLTHPDWATERTVT